MLDTQYHLLTVNSNLYLHNLSLSLLLTVPAVGFLFEWLP